MKKKKENFFKRLKNAVTNFDKYREYSDEKLSVSMKYILKLILIFSIIITIALVIKINRETNKILRSFKENAPEFKIENNNLITQEGNNHFIIGDSSNSFGLVIDSEKENLSEVEEANNYKVFIMAMLKDKIVLRNYLNIENSITYEKLGENYEISNLDKQSILSYVTNKNILMGIASFAITSIIFLFISYLIEILLDIVFLSLVGFIFSKIIGINFKYKQVFNMSVYAITLSVILYMIYIVVNILTGFVVKYFEVAYNAIAYIYIMTAMMMIKSDLTKEKIMVGKIIQEQKKVREKNNTEEENKEKEDKKEKKQKEKKKEKDEQGETPEGSNA